MGMNDTWNYFGAMLRNFLHRAGGLSLLLWDVLRNLHSVFLRPSLTFEQMVVMGIRSIPLVVFSAIFTGAVAALQAAYQFGDYVPMRYLGTAVGKAVIIELGPVLTALVVAGRVGAAIAAELGTMRVTEQIDALETLALNPVRFLVVPRVISGVVMLPVLTIFADVVGLLGGLFVCMYVLGIPSTTFLSGVKLFFHMKDLLAGLIKAAVFGGILSWVGCYYGFITEGGAEGVGLSTTQAVVVAMVGILVADYVIASLLF